ncbi:SDR family oxidoreductase [Bacillus haikouensis]|uniref:SDR family NAD(P)-dependent oxidoreductase n=1 Tax=Bacillus haikouensis TaxID=1510468 RepID=UPI00155634DC|nr:SDR family NAD(P)-dependent oxidoreductase [Bacillus haikouensis]NQD68121.1 SDR family oxidoreductase [Bacillus haikouensis]
MSDRKKQRVIVTGGSKGLGRGIALAFAEAGASVVIADVDTEAGERCVQEINESGGEGLFVYTDVSSSEDVKKLFEESRHFHGGIDVLVNNAGIGHGPMSERHFLKTDYGMWENLMNIHINGLYHCSQLAARAMVHQGEGGSIINMSSGGATRAHRNRVAYDATKGAIEAATRAMALDLAPWKIRVNAVMPGSMWVENRTAVGNESSPDLLIPLGRLGMPQDVGHGVRFLASPDASYITGHVLAIDGGLTAQLRAPSMDADVALSLDEIDLGMASSGSKD